MLELLSKPWERLSESLEWQQIAGLISFVAIVAIAYFVGRVLPFWLGPFFRRFISPQAEGTYKKIVEPHANLFGWVFLAAIAECSVLFLGFPSFVEFATSLLLAASAPWLISRLIEQFFEVYLFDIFIKQGGKVNEIVLVFKILANAVVVVLALLFFAQAHQINVFGLLASLGIGGLAVAFAAKKTLEQILGGIVLYLDRPFAAGDYIGLPDGTFGKVESIGVRSTKIRSTGKGTLVIVPNNSLNEMTIENFTDAKKVIAILYLNFHSAIPRDERSLIRQVIIESTNNIFGIDPRNTDVDFHDLYEKGEEKRTQAQLTFFILGSGEASMELRRQVLDTASEKIREKLTGYGILFDFDRPTIYVDSPITI